ncbi:MAG: 3-deoxy-D-manno-octulosonic acid transferase, partial [Desulfobulbus sp.]
LVERGGHNIMEAARWGRPVYYGPHIKDFKDAAKLLRDNGGGFQVADAQALLALMRHHHTHPEAYDQACRCAAEIAAGQRGAVARQVALTLQCLESRC